MVMPSAPPSPFLPPLISSIAGATSSPSSFDHDRGDEKEKEREIREDKIERKISQVLKGIKKNSYFSELLLLREKERGALKISVLKKQKKQK